MTYTAHLQFIGLSFFGFREGRDPFAAENRLPVRSSKSLGIPFQSLLVEAGIMYFTGPCQIALGAGVPPDMIGAYSVRSGLPRRQ